MRRCLRSNDQTARISLQISRNVKQQRNKTNRSRQTYLAPTARSFPNLSAPSPKQVPYLAIPQSPVKTLLDKSSQRPLRAPPGSTSRLPRPSQRPRRSVKRYLGGDADRGKRNLRKSFMRPPRNFHLLDFQALLARHPKCLCSSGSLKASRTATAARIASGFPGQIL